VLRVRAGGLSFGHAAYFGLGAYGTGLMLKFITHSTPLAIVEGNRVVGLLSQADTVKWLLLHQKR